VIDLYSESRSVNLLSISVFKCLCISSSHVFSGVPLEYELRISSYFEVNPSVTKLIIPTLLKLSTLLMNEVDKSY